MIDPILKPLVLFHQHMPLLSSQYTNLYNLYRIFRSRHFQLHSLTVVVEVIVYALYLYILCTIFSAISGHSISSSVTRRRFDVNYGRRTYNNYNSVYASSPLSRPRSVRSHNTVQHPDAASRPGPFASSFRVQYKRPHRRRRHLY